MLRPATPEPVACAPAILANTLALCRDVAVYPTNEELPFREVHADLDLRVRVSACTDYLAAMLDCDLNQDLRSRAASLAEELLRDEPVRRQIDRIFLSVAPPDDADLPGARERSWDRASSGLLLSGIDRAALFVAPLEELWEEEKNHLPSLADRASADGQFRQRPTRPTSPARRKRSRSVRRPSSMKTALLLGATSRTNSIRCVEYSVI